MVNTIPKVLIVDDDKAICDFISESLVGEGYACDSASTAKNATTKLFRHHFDMILLDIKLPDKSGLDLLKTSRTLFKDALIIIISAVSDLDTAVQAMKLGASDYVVKPFTVDRLISSLSTALKKGAWNRITTEETQDLGSTKFYSKIRDRSLSPINALSYGVEAHVDYFDSHSKIVTKKTIELARRLDLPENEIKKWRIQRHKLLSERSRYIKAALNKLEKNPIAQIMLGMARPVCHILKQGGEQD